MANRRNKRPKTQRGGKANGSRSGGRATAASPSVSELAATAEELEAGEQRASAEMANLLKDVELSDADEPEPARPETDVTGEIDAERLRTALAQAKRARERAERRVTRFTSAKAELEKKYQTRHEQLGQRETRLAEERAAHETEVAEFERRKEELDEREGLIAKRAERVHEQEEEAKSGFAEMRHEQLARLHRELDERRAAFDRELDDREKRLTERFTEKEAGLASRARELEDRAAELEKAQLELERMQRRNTAREEFLDQEVDDRIRDQRRERQVELEAARQEALEWRQRYEKISDVATTRAEKLAEQEAAMIEFGGRTAAEVMAELRELRAKNAELCKAAAAHPASERERVEEIESRNHDLMVERERLVQQNAELRRQAAASKISAIERENSRMVNQALERLNKTLSDEIHQQTMKLEELQASSQSSSPFPSCFAMDQDERYARRPELDHAPVDLREFITGVRALMAARQGLYYTEADLRCFVAGLAASRLHLLQGISGIGKTRLPQAFARAIGASCDTVAVAAEWRSPQDLMGYYNPFERKFYETDFTQALYKAQLPLFQDKPFFVVLDEMNLSHPEQYFSDLLSALESKAGSSAEPARLRLMTAKVEPAPSLLHDGRSLELPDNVWFVGTANNDETTVRFAPKTYDRAHVLELPSKPVAFEPGDPRPVAPVSMKGLTAGFDDAVLRFGHMTDQVLDFFEREIGDRLREDFGAAWGPRLRRQAERFVPVTVAANGDAGEAADHLLATKILRSLSGRIEIPATQLRMLQEHITAAWGKAFPGTRPEKSVRALESEIRSRGIG